MINELPMNSLGLVEAAKLLRMHKSTLAARARAHLVPASKPGREWCFLYDDLLAYMRAQYGAPKVLPPCSINKPTVKTGGPISIIPGSLGYVGRLEQRIALRRKSSKTN